MRNLRAISLEETRVDGSLPLTATAWDVETDSVLCAFGPTPDQPTIELKRKYSIQNPNKQLENHHTSQFTSITSWDAPCPLPDLPCDEILLMQHFSATGTICLVLAGGDLILVREDPTADQEEIEIVGSIDVGIAAAAWAPDEELLAIVTRADGLVLMSRNLEPVTESSMTFDDLQASRHVSVGWGKKETQFQGKRAKAMRDPTVPDHIDEGLPSTNEDGSVTISWRGDGAYLAINSFVTNHRRAIRVYSREGILDSVSEPVDGLESALSWKPSGSLIASVKQTVEDGVPSKVEVIFFERNGLRHGDFALRLAPGDVKDAAKHIQLSWNTDSTVLAVSYLRGVQFWTMGNYHYYLKQEIPMITNAKSPIIIKWHPEYVLKCCLGAPEVLLSLENELQVCRGSTVTPNDHGIVAVIDGCMAKLTPFKYAGVPPPMAFCEIDAEQIIVDCAINHNGNFVALLTRDSLQLYDWEMRYSEKKGGADHRHTTNFRKLVLNLSQISRAHENVYLSKVCFKGGNDLYLMTSVQGSLSSAQTSHIRLTEHLSAQWDAESVVQSISSVDTPISAQGLISDVNQEGIWAQCDEKTFYICKRIDSNEPESVLSATHMRSCTPFSIPGDATSFYKAYLTYSGQLFVEGHLLARDCTSYILTDTHLVFTTSQHLLKFIHLAYPQALQVPESVPEVDERCRSVERGAKIVTIVPSTYAVVLQMPRGNLETIYPRILVLAGIRKSLKELEYRTAFSACQNHQVDMNILCDYLPDLFLDNVTKFIQDIKKPSWIDEFLSKLKEEDVTQTLYKDTLQAAEQPNTNEDDAKRTTGTTNTATTSGKVNRICDAFIAVLSAKPSRYLQNVISAHVCKQPPDLTAALTLVSSLRKNAPDEADMAVSHLCFLTDTNRLYDAALALYDLELTLLVAQNAQRDPREYMPFLQSLQVLPGLRRQYQIDNHLRNYSKALVSLHSLGAHEEVEVYAIRHLLYTTAIELYKFDKEHLPKITRLYAEYLESKSQHASAAILYESLEDYEKAHRLYALAHQWREALTCAMLVPLEQTKLQNFSSSLSINCAEEFRDYRSAATIQVEYLNDTPAAARLLCKGSYFADAARILVLKGLRAEIPNIINPGLTEKFGEIIELVADCKGQLSSQLPRIAELRKKKAEDPLAFYGGDAAAMAADGVDIPDNISLAATDTSTVGGQSLFTRYGSNASKFGGTVASNVSRKTSRTKRREERKRARGKKGSVYEEEYLSSSVGRLIERINGVQDEVKRLVSGLLRASMREQAAKVDEVMGEISQMCEHARKEVWQIAEPVMTEDASNTYDINGEGRPPGADGVFWDSQQATGNEVRKHAPEVKTWSNNTLVMR